MAWLNGIDLDRLNELKRRVDRQHGSTVVRTGRRAASALRKCEAKLPLQQTVNDMAYVEECPVEDVLGYLAALGLCLLIACKED